MKWMKGQLRLVYRYDVTNNMCVYNISSKEKARGSPQLRAYSSVYLFLC